MMVCETEQGILDDALANYDAVALLRQAHDLEGQQIQMQELAAMGQAMMAYSLLQNCLENSGNGPMAVSPEAEGSPRAIIPSASEFLEFQKNVLPSLLKSRK
jgi:hypothetical protein